MPSEARSVFLLVRRLADLEPIGEQLAAYLGFLRSRSAGSAVDVIQGIWVDEEGVANLPPVLVLPDLHGARRTVRILETTGINGIWVLCRLDAAARTISRVELVAALRECFGHAGTEAAAHAARFIPVFAGDASESDMRDESRALEVHYPGLVLDPIRLHRDGAPGLSLGQPHHAGALS